MNKKIAIGRWEASCILINLLSAKIFLGYASGIAETAGTAVWIVSIYISILAFLAFALISKMYSQFYGMDILDIAQYVGGNILRVCTGVIITVIFMFSASMILREFSENLKVIALENSPISYIGLFFFASIILAAYFGIDAIGRIHAIILPFILAGALFIAVGASPYYDCSNIFPLMGTGAGDVFVKGFLRVSSFGELLAIFLLIPFMKNYKEFKKTGYISIVVSGISLTIASFAGIFVYPYPVIMENFLPIYNISKLINYGRFFQRVESMFVFIWAASAILYLCATFFLGIYSFKKTLKLQYYKPLIFPLAILVFNLSFLPSSLMSTLNLTINYLRNFEWIATFGMPILLLAIALLIKRQKMKTRKKL